MLLVWVVESWCSSVWSSAETTLIHLILFVHEYYTVILLMAISSFKAAIDGTSNWPSSVWELTSCLFVWLVQCICSTISCRLTSTTYGSVVSTSCITVTISLSESTNIHSCIHCIHISKVTWTTLDRSLPVVINIDSGIHVLVVTITLYRHGVFMLLLNWVTSTTVLSLLSELSLSNCFVDLLVTLIRILAWWVHAWEHLIIVLSGVEELLGCHHHLLVVILASVWSFPLVDQIE